MQLVLSQLFKFLFILSVQAHLVDKKCEKRFYESDSNVCVCNATYCDTIAAPKKEQVNGGEFMVYTSNKAGLRFEKTFGKFLPSDLYINGIFINREKRYQSMIGWGGAFTDSTGMNIASLEEEEAQTNLLKSYFSSDGIEYNMGRIPIAGTDFSTRGYSYDDGNEDRELKNFTLQPEDLIFKIPYMKKARELRNGNLSFFAAAWSCPKWMNTLNSYDAFFGMVKLDMYQEWANYHIKFLEEYKKQEIDFWGISTGNEPTTAFWNSGGKINRIGWTPELHAQWIAENFGPAMRSNFPDVKVMILDDQRYLLPWVAKFLISKATVKYIDGIAMHWYADAMFSPVLLGITHAMWPKIFLLSTEGSIAVLKPPVLLGSWRRGELYSQDIIQDCKNWVCGWVDWNMALNLEGGPTWENNNIDAPIIVNASAGEFYKQPTYYHLGHFSKFVPENSARIDSLTDDNDLQNVAFERPDGGIVVVILNINDKIIPVSIFDENRGVAKLALSKRSITTILYW